MYMSYKLLFRLYMHFKFQKYHIYDTLVILLKTIYRFLAPNKRHQYIFGNFKNVDIWEIIQLLNILAFTLRLTANQTNKRNIILVG